MNFSFPLARPVFRTGMQRYALFFNFQNFFQKISKKFESSKALSRQSFQELMPLQTPVFQMGVQRYDFLINFQIFSHIFSNFFHKKNASENTFN